MCHTLFACVKETQANCNRIDVPWLNQDHRCVRELHLRYALQWQRPRLWMLCNVNGSRLHRCTCHLLHQTRAILTTMMLLRRTDYIWICRGNSKIWNKIEDVRRMVDVPQRNCNLRVTPPRNFRIKVSSIVVPRGVPSPSEFSAIARSWFPIIGPENFFFLYLLNGKKYMISFISQVNCLVETQSYGEISDSIHRQKSTDGHFFKCRFRARLWEDRRVSDYWSIDLLNAV